jgi:FkbM family methyltransferase
VLDISYLKKIEFKTLIDIGANNGEYGEFLKNIFNIKRVLAFEPLPDKLAILTAKGFEVFPIALHSESGDADFIVNQYDAASSLYSLTKTTMAEWPKVSELSVIKVKKSRLDDCVDQIESPLLIKVDAQGAEAEIIDGGENTFALAKVVLIEVSFIELYEKQSLFNDIHIRLTKLGFSLSGFKMQHVAKDGRPLFAHCIYSKPELATAS